VHLFPEWDVWRTLFCFMVPGVQACACSWMSWVHRCTG
jgi:hypothetical protein